ncbi:tetratricopeptide repeat protein [Lutibacter sp.]
MKQPFLHRLLLIVILLILSISKAQNINIEEENDLKFQTFFFEALKQKAIKNYTKAIENLEKCYEIDSLNIAVEFELSKNELLLKNYAEAISFIDKALEKEPENIYLLKHKVTIYKAQRNFKDAIEIQKKVIEIQPKNIDELLLLYFENKDFKKAEKLIVEIEKKAFSTQRIKRLKKYLKNRKLLDKKVNIKITSSLSDIDLKILKEAYNQKKEYKILVEILNREVNKELFEDLYNDSLQALELFPAQPYLYKMNGFALNKLGKYNEAIDVLTLGTDFVIDNTIMEADFYEELSKSYKGLNDMNKALKFIQKARDLRNQN